MKTYETSDLVLQEDLNRIAEGTLDFDLLDGKNVLITGATGLIGSQIVKSLAAINRLQNRNIGILAGVRNIVKAQKLFAEQLDLPEFQIVDCNVSKPITIKEDIDYIIHGASATSSKFFIEHPVETIDIALNGTMRVLELARKKKVQGFVYLSSLEVYGVPDAKETITETDYGYLDPMQVRSSYSEGKRMVECLCVSYASEYGVPVKIARLSQTFGPGVEYNDGRVFAEFARCVLEKKNIVLHTAGRTVRTYCYIADAIDAILHILLKGSVAQAYNVTNEETKSSIYEMAQIVCNTYPQQKIEVEVEDAADVSGFGYNPEMVIVLDNTKLKDLGWKPQVDLSQMFVRMIDSMNREK